MPYLLGTDEAGYGPNLGPLVISTTRWHVPSAPEEIDLYDLLSDSVAQSPDGRRLAIADSKALYKPGGGVRLLERGLLPAMELAGSRVTGWNSLWEGLSADPEGHRHRIPWYADYSTQLPLSVEPDELDRLAISLRRSLEAAGVRLEAVRSRAVFPEQFNALVDRYGSKGLALSRLTLGLLSDTLADTEPEPVLVVCDKHGGRNRYGQLLQESFPDRLVEVHGESRRLSRYRWGPSSSRTEIRFAVGGEAFLPTALASMASKYLREMSMRALNDYWCGQVDNLRPTAGYPVDARRFKSEIAQCQQGLGIDDRLLWRKK